MCTCPVKTSRSTSGPACSCNSSSVSPGSEPAPCSSGAQLTAARLRSIGDELQQFQARRRRAETAKWRFIMRGPGYQHLGLQGVLDSGSLGSLCVALLHITTQLMLFIGRRRHL